MNRRTEAKDVTVFGRFLTELMDRKDMTLRELSRRSGIDASNLSKMERGVIYPPRKPETLTALAEALELDEVEAMKLSDLAHLASGMLPESTTSLQEIEAIPMLLRAIDNQELTQEQVRKLAEIIEKENSWQGRLMD